MQPQESAKHGLQKRLEEELKRLKSKLGLAGRLRVVWNPKTSSEETHGMVNDSPIHIFDDEEEEALDTLRHEYVEYVLTHEFLEPRIFEAKAHRRADFLVDILASLI